MTTAVEIPTTAVEIPTTAMSVGGTQDGGTQDSKTPSPSQTPSSLVATAVIASVMSLVVVGGCACILAVFIGIVLRVRHRRKRFWRITEVRKKAPDPVQ